MREHKRMWILIASLLLFGAGLSRQVDAKEYNYSENLPKQVIVFGFMEIAPIKYANNTGPFLDDLRKLFDYAGLDYTLTVRPTTRLFVDMRRGKIDMWYGNKQAFKESEIIWTICPGFSLILDEYYIKGKAGPISLKNKEQLRGRSVAMWAGYMGGIFPWLRAPENGVIFNNVHSHEAAFAMLKLKKVDYVIDYRMPATEALKNVTVPGLESINLQTVPLYLGIMRNNRKDYREIARKLDEAYIALFYSLNTTRMMIEWGEWKDPAAVLDAFKAEYAKVYQ